MIFFIIAFTLFVLQVEGYRIYEYFANDPIITFKFPVKRKTFLEELWENKLQTKNTL